MFGEKIMWYTCMQCHRMVSRRKRHVSRHAKIIMQKAAMHMQIMQSCRCNHEELLMQIKACKFTHADVRVSMQMQ